MRRTIISVFVALTMHLTHDGASFFWGKGVHTIYCTAFIVLYTGLT